MLNGIKRMTGWVNNWSTKFYPGWTRWIFYGLILSFVFLAASGFFFAVFISRGLFGLPLLLHVVAGGIFAICLSLVVVWRARDYADDVVFPFLYKALFWTFVFAGLCLIVTSLSSMLSFLSMEFQITMIRWHRFFALVSLVSVSVFMQASLTSEK